jgi:DNA-binding transcriptional ArsR family regulator
MPKNFIMPSKPVPDRLLIDKPAQLAALTSPLRMELVELFGVWGPCAVGDVAARMERAPDSLYYHVRKLVRVGLLEAVRERRKGHRFETVYRLTAREFEFPRTSTKRAVREQLSKAMAAMLRQTGRELEAALDDPDLPGQGPQRRLYGRRSRGRFSAKALRELNRHIDAIDAICAREAVRPNRGQGESLVLTLIMSPGIAREEA